MPETGSWNVLQKKKMGRIPVFLAKQMLRFQVFQLGYLLCIGLVYDWWVLAYALAVAVFGFLLLESVNYIEHYGLRRKTLPNGRPDPVQAWHSGIRTTSWSAFFCNITN